MFAVFPGIFRYKKLVPKLTGLALRRIPSRATKCQLNWTNGPIANRVHFIQKLEAAAMSQDIVSVLMLGRDCPFLRIISTPFESGFKNGLLSMDFKVGIERGF